MGSVATKLFGSYPAASAVSNLRADLEHTTKRLENIEAEMKRGFGRLEKLENTVNERFDRLERALKKQTDAVFDLV